MADGIQWDDEPGIKWDEAQPVAPEPSRLQRVAAALKSLPAQGLRLGLKAGQYYGNAIAHPIDTARDLADMEGTGGAVVRGFGKGASAGFIDELDGVAGAYGEIGSTLSDLKNGPLIQRMKARGMSENPVLAAYREHRDQRRHDDEVSRQGSPDAFGAAQLGGAAAMPVAKAGLAGRLAQGAGYGGAYGLGESKADLTKGETGPALRDAGEGAAVGLGAALAVEPAMALGRYSTALKAQGKAGEIAAVGKAASKDFGKARGGLGSDTRGTLTKLKTADDILASPLATPEMKAQAQAFLDSEIGKQTRLTAWQNTLDDLPNQMGQMGEARGSMEAAAAAAAPEAVEATAMQNLSESVIKKEVLPRVDRLVGNKALSMIGQFGGAPITTTKNLLKSPHVQYRSGQIGEAAAVPMTAVGKALQPGGAQMLEDYLRPKDDEERQEQAASWFTSATSVKAPR